MLLDGLASSHPVSQEVLRATDIDRVFDWIAYKKVGIDKTQVPSGYFIIRVAKIFYARYYILLLFLENRNGL